MKKIGLIISLILVLAGCQSEKTTSKDSVTSESIEEMSSIQYKLVLEDAKANEKEQEKITDEVKQIGKVKTFDELNSIADLEKKTELGIQGIVVASDPYSDIDEDVKEGKGRTRLTIMVSRVFYGEQTFVGQTIEVEQPTGFVKRSQIVSKKEASTMSSAELSEVELVGVNGIGPAKIGTELIAYLSKNKDGQEDALQNYVFYGIGLSRFDKNEKTGKYQQVLAPGVKATSNALTKAINELVD